MPFENRSFYLSTVAYARRRPSANRNCNRVEPRPVTRLPRPLPAVRVTARRRVILAPLARAGDGIAYMLRGLWMRVRRARESARVAAAWERMDDRTLRDIGMLRGLRHETVSWRYWS
ncbi:MAG TPA: hypothetical protein VMC10_15455 [Stellaceae bacterium]|nr:hypothetical protein [Stellaceae bacterium]